MAVTTRTKRKTEAEVLDQATEQLLAAIKSKASVEGKKLSYEKLHEQGYSKRFLTRLQRA